MEKFVNQYDKECMKMALLKHEEIFREQVFELHRLYQIQKMLMKNIPRARPEENEQKFFDIHNGNTHQGIQYKDFDLEQQEKENAETSNDAGGGLECEDEFEIELTLGPTSYNRRRKLETPAASDSAHSFSSSSTGSSNIKRGEIKIGNVTGNVTTHSWGFVEVPGPNPQNFFGVRKVNSDIEEERQDRLKQPPWMYQALGLNMT